MNNLSQAIRFAHLCHTGQRRKYIDEPYINHPVRVMQAVTCDHDFGGDEEMSMAAVLHDVVEDTWVKILNPYWGEYVVKWVDELTNEFTKENYPSMNRRQRKAAEFARLADISLEAKVIKLYDRLDNLQSWFQLDGLLCDETTRRFALLYAGESMDMVRAISNTKLLVLENEVMRWAEKLREAC